MIQMIRKLQRTEKYQTQALGLRAGFLEEVLYMLRYRLVGGSEWAGGEGRVPHVWNQLFLGKLWLEYQDWGPCNQSKWCHFLIPSQDVLCFSYIGLNRVCNSILTWLKNVLSFHCPFCSPNFWAYIRQSINISLIKKCLGLKEGIAEKTVDR